VPKSGKDFAMRLVRGIVASISSGGLRRNSDFCVIRFYNFLAALSSADRTFGMCLDCEMQDFNGVAYFALDDDSF